MSDGCVKHERLTGVCLECLEDENERLLAALQKQENREQTIRDRLRRAVSKWRNVWKDNVAVGECAAEAQDIADNYPRRIVLARGEEARR